jgi:hypothetical protein
MKIKLRQFGESLSSRETGKDAYSSFLSTLATLDTDEPIEIDFEGVSSLSPSWGDEFLSPLLKKLKNKLILFNTTNLSVDATINFLAEINKQNFNRQS